MRKICLATFFMIFLFDKAVLGDSLLTAQSFPKTANDVTFIQNIMLMQEGYEPWETIYDVNGRCVSGCLYPGITIQEDLRLADERTKEAWTKTKQYIKEQERKILEPIKSNVNLQHIVTAVQQAKPTYRSCTPLNQSIPENQNLPLGNPLMGMTKITSGFGSRIHPVTGELSTHWGIDFSAPIGTNVFATANGVVESVKSDSTCGNGLTIAHSDGYKTVFCHLNKVTVQKGDSVKAGCKVAETGNTGRTTGPHLHYAIKTSNGFIDPTKWVNAKS